MGSRGPTKDEEAMKENKHHPSKRGRRLPSKDSGEDPKA